MTDIGGFTVDTMIKRTMSTIIAPAMETRFNLTGQQGKRKFAGTNLYDAVLSKLNYISSFMLIHINTLTVLDLPVGSQ